MRRFPPQSTRLWSAILGVVALSAAISSVQAQPTPTFNVSTQLLTMPSVTVVEAGGSNCYSVVMQADPAFKFSLQAATPTSCSDNPQIAALAGSYAGTANGPPFGTDPVTITVQVNGTTAVIDADQFYGGVCRYTGTIGSDGYSINNGTYQCSDFSSGTWTLNQIKKVDLNDIYISLNSSGRGLKRMYGMMR